MSGFYNCAKFHYHQVAREKIIDKRILKFLVSDHFNMNYRTFRGFRRLVCSKILGIMKAEKKYPTENTVEERGVFTVCNEVIKNLN